MTFAPEVCILTVTMSRTKDRNLGGTMLAERVTFRGHEWHLESTGGNCTAYERTESDGSYFMLTTLGDPSAPEPGDAAWIGKYDAESQCIVSPDDDVCVFIPDDTPDSAAMIRAAIDAARDALDRAANLAREFSTVAEINPALTWNIRASANEVEAEIIARAAEVEKLVDFTW